MSSLLSFVGWTFLPDLVTNNLQSFYYNLTIRAGSPKPQPGSPQFVKHRRRIYVGVILAYLCYTLFEVDWQIQRDGDFYSVLGVPVDADDRTIQSRFRKLTLLHHPDKLPSNVSPDVFAAVQANYVSLTVARDTLLSPHKRYAYDRLGPIITDASWASLKTTHDYISAGLNALLPFYVASFGGLWLAGYLGFIGSDGDMYWRYLALALMAVAEVHVLTRPWHTILTKAPTIFNPWINAAAVLPGFGGWKSLARSPYLPFQAVIAAHRALAAFFIALGRFGPISRSANDGKAVTGTGDAAVLEQVGRLEQMIVRANMEASRQLALEIIPFRTTNASQNTAGAPTDEIAGTSGHTTDKGLETLRRKIKEWFINNTIRQDPEVRQAVESVIETRRQEASGR